jgi:hypothetical protein
LATYRRQRPSNAWWANEPAGRAGALTRDGAPALPRRLLHKRLPYLVTQEQNVIRAKNGSAGTRPSNCAMSWRFRQTHSAGRVRCSATDPKLILPGQYGVRGAGAVAADDHARTSPYLDDVVKFTRHAHSGERGVHDQTHAFRVKSSTTVRMRKRRPMTTYPSRSRATSADSDPAGSLSAPESQVSLCGHRNGDGCPGPP